ncbi:MAG: PIN domain-containing protein [Deltaproteobacteria bacterium]|nr:PIN domain-containing protein [Deltaproteobacteria bacterium]
MVAKVFVDTNVLVYCRDASEPEKQKQAMSWIAHLWNTRTGRLSFQVLQEFYVTVTEKLDPGLDRASARHDVLFLLTWNPLPVEGRVMEGAWFIQDRHRLSWWDSLIVSAAQVADCNYLLTEDLQEHQEFGKVLVINPFRQSSALLAK